MTSKSAATMGPLKVDKPDPKNFMKKYTKTAPLEKDVPEERKPPVPTRIEKPVMGLTTQKNFLKENLAEAAHTAPKKVDQEQEDFLKKDEYGQIPEYLKKIKQTIEEEKAEEVEQQEKARNANKKFRLLTYEEREELTRGLQENYEKISTAYNQLPVAIHTLSQKARKEQYEKQLQTIEKDLEKLSRRHVYVPIDQNAELWNLSQ